MKKITAMILALALIFALASCNVGNIGNGGTSNTADPLKASDAAGEKCTIKLKNNDTEYVLSESEAETISDILGKYAWVEFPQPDTATDYELNIEGKRYFYHSGTGVTLDSVTNCRLSEADTENVNEILFKYVSPLT